MALTMLQGLAGGGLLGSTNLVATASTEDNAGSALLVLPLLTRAGLLGGQTDLDETVSGLELE